MGAAQLLHLSLMHPRLFTTLIMLEPITGKCINTCSGPILTKLSTFRRDIWNSHEEACLSASKAYRNWDKRVLERWCKYGLRTLPTAIHPQQPEGATAAVTLTTTKHQEVMSYLRPNFEGKVAKVYDRLRYPDLVGPPDTIYPFYRAEPIQIHKMLENLRPSICYIFGSKSPVSTEVLRAEKMELTGSGVGGSGGAAEGRVKEVVLEGCGHMIAQEAAKQCADIAAEWLEVEIMKWKTDETRLMKGWAEKSPREKSMVSEDWMKHIGQKSSKL